MQARCSSANVRPCSGSTTAIAGSQAVTAVTLHRTIPALAARAAEPAGPSHRNSVGPTTTKTTTSARTPSDHNSPAAPGPMPPSSQRNTSKPSCSPWLLITKAASAISGKKPGAASKARTLACRGAKGRSSAFRGSQSAATAASASSVPFIQTMPPRTRFLDNLTSAHDAHDKGGRGRTAHPPYWNRPGAAASVIASAIGTMGASVEACATLTMRKIANPAGKS